MRLACDSRSKRSFKSSLVNKRRGKVWFRIQQFPFHLIEISDLTVQIVGSGKKSVFELYANTAVNACQICRMRRFLFIALKKKMASWGLNVCVCVCVCVCVFQPLLEEWQHSKQNTPGDSNAAGSAMHFVRCY